MNLSDEPNPEVFSQVLSCIFSGTDFNAFSKPILSLISQNSEEFIKDFLVSINEILNSQTYSPHAKFYALLLLVKATETKSPGLVNQFAFCQGLMNKLFQDAQFDRTKSLGEKGKTFFNNAPSKEESVIGNNYLNLLLEAIVFWGNEFGSLGKKESKNIFLVIYENLSQRTQLPTTYSFIGKNQQYNENFHLEPVQTGQAENGAQVNNQNGNKDLETSEAFLQLVTCITSEEDYEKESKLVFDSVKKNDKKYNKMLLQSINEILTKSEYTYNLKFYALYLLIRLTETANKTFLANFSQDTKLLNHIYKLAKEAGTLTGPKAYMKSGSSDTETEYKNNFNILILEAVMFWYNTYGNPDPNHTYYNFFNMHKALSNKVLLPDKFIYIQREEEEKVIEKEKQPEIIKNIPEQKIEENKVSKRKSSHEVVQTSLIKQMHLCIENGTKFKDYHISVIESLLYDQNEAINYLAETFNILNSEDYSPSSKFYTLYLLVRATEIAENDFIMSLAKSLQLLSKFFQDAQFDKHKIPEQKGITFFGKKLDAESSRIASNYIQLLTEAIHFWGRSFQTEDRKNPKYTFKSMSEQLLKMTKIEEQNYYLGRNLNLLDEYQMSQFELIPFKFLPPLVPRNEFGSIQSVEDDNILSPHLLDDSVSNGHKNGALINNKIMKPKVNMQKFYASDMKDDIDSPRLSSLNNSYLKNQKDISIKSSKQNSPIKIEVYKARISSHEKSPKTNGVLKHEARFENQAPSSKTRPDRIIESNSQKVNITEREQIEKIVHDSPRHIEKSMRRSLVTTPKHYEEDLSKLEHDIRASKTKLDSLVEIEESIKKSFKTSGKTPPNFNTFSGMEVVVGLEEEVIRLKKEKDELRKENEWLKNQTENIAKDLDGKDSMQTSQIEDLRELLADYQKKIETIQKRLEENSIDKKEKSGKKSRNVSQDFFEKSRHGDSSQKLRISHDILPSPTQLESSTPKNAFDFNVKSPILDSFILKSASMNIDTLRKSEFISERPKTLMNTEISPLRKSLNIHIAETTSKTEVPKNRNGTRDSIQRNKESSVTEHFLKKSHVINTENPLAKSRVFSNDRNITGASSELDKFLSPKAQLWYDGIELPRVRASFFEEEVNYQKRESLVFEASSGNERGSHNLRKSLKPSNYRSNLLQGLKLRISDTASAQNMLYNYKRSCLKKASILYEDNNLRIETNTNLLESHSENVLGIILHYRNIGNETLQNLSIDFPEIYKADIFDQPKIDHILLKEQEHVNHQVFFSFNEWPMQVPQLYGSYKTSRNRENFSVFLPTLITHFMSFVQSDVDSFERLSKRSNLETIESDEIILDPSIIQGPHDFQRYFDKLLDLNMFKRPEMVSIHDTEASFGGVFRLNWVESDYLLKVQVYDVNKVVFKVMTNEEENNYVDVILETLSFIFGRD